MTQEHLSLWSALVSAPPPPWACVNNWRSQVLGIRISYQSPHLLNHLDCPHQVLFHRNKKAFSFTYYHTRSSPGECQLLLPVWFSQLLLIFAYLSRVRTLLFALLMFCSNQHLPCLFFADPISCEPPPGWLWWAWRASTLLYGLPGSLGQGSFCSSWLWCLPDSQYPWPILHTK